MDIMRCRNCGTNFDTPQGKILHDCTATRVKICPDCHLTKPCECDDA